MEVVIISDINEILFNDKFQSHNTIECSENSESMKQPAVYSDITHIFLWNNSHLKIECTV